MLRVRVGPPAAGEGVTGGVHQATAIMTALQLVIGLKLVGDGIAGLTGS